MIKINFTEASGFESCFLKKDFNLKISQSALLIGRGEELEQRKSSQIGVIDLKNFDNTLSKVHASLNFSPAWFNLNSQNKPKYLNQIKLNQQALPADIKEKIWQFIRPKKECFLRDLKSKVGIFKKIDQQLIEPGNFFLRSEMIIEFSHQCFIKFQYSEQYQTLEQLQRRVEFYYQNGSQTKQEYKIFGNLQKVRLGYQKASTHQEKAQILKIWHFSIKNLNYILMIEQDLVLRIGRSSHCQVQIKERAISRFQAYFKCQNRKWKIFDGSQQVKSKNGTWKREKSIPIPIIQSQHSNQSFQVKIGTIKSQIQLIEKFDWLDISKIINGDLSKSFIQIGIKDDKEKILELSQNFQQTLSNDFLY